MREVKKKAREGMNISDSEGISKRTWLSPVLDWRRRRNSPGLGGGGGGRSNGRSEPENTVVSLSSSMGGVECL